MFSSRHHRFLYLFHAFLETEEEAKADSRDFLYLVVFVPTQIALCVWFLYAILGWAAWVALVSIVLLIPVPGYGLCEFIHCGLKLKYFQCLDSPRESKESVSSIRTTEFRVLVKVSIFLRLTFCSRPTPSSYEYTQNGSYLAVLLWGIVLIMFDTTR